MNTDGDSVKRGNLSAILGRMMNANEGQSLVLIGLMMVGMIGFLGLILDGGAAFVTRRNSQDVSDSAAFAGVRVLVTRPNDNADSERAVWQAIATYASGNRADPSTDIVATFIDANGADIRTINPAGSGIPTSPLATGVRVTTTLHFQPYFIVLLIGNSQIPIQASAAAQSGPLSVGDQLMPMTIKPPCPVYDPNDPNCALRYDVTYQIFGNPQVGGGFQWVDYSGGSSANDIVHYLDKTWSSGKILADKQDTYYNSTMPTQYNSPPPYPNPWVPSGPGVQPNKNISDALDCWINLDGAGCWPQPGPAKPADRVWLVPVYNHTNEQSGANAKYHVATFAQFEFLGYWFANNQCNWVGKTSAGKCNNNPPGSLSPDLQPCENRDTNDGSGKCVIGKFKKEVINLEIRAGYCNSNGLNTCGLGLAQ